MKQKQNIKKDVKTKWTRTKIKGYINGSIIIVVVFLLWPYFIVNHFIEKRNIEKRGKETFCTIYKIEDRISKHIYYFEYEVNDKKYNNSIRTNKKDWFLGYQLKIKYDSLNPETYSIIWTDK